LAYNLTTKKLKTKTFTIMRKYIYMALLALVSSLALSSCTEDEVTPTSEYSTGGSSSGDVIK
jgi:hypothetical protein